MTRYIITEEQITRIENGFYPTNLLFTEVRSHPYNPQAEREKQCGTCKHKGTRACSHHGYDYVPISCSYKLGIYAEEAMKNLNETFIDVWTPEHNKQVREKVLDEVLQLPQHREQPNGSMYIYVNDVKRLRQGGKVEK